MKKSTDIYRKTVLTKAIFRIVRCNTCGRRCSSFYKEIYNRQLFKSVRDRWIGIIKEWNRPLRTLCMICYRKKIKKIKR